MSSRCRGSGGSRHGFWRIDLDRKPDCSDLGFACWCDFMTLLIVVSLGGWKVARLRLLRQQDLADLPSFASVLCTVEKAG